MKLRKTLYCLAIIFLIAIPVLAQNTNPVVTNVAFSISGTTVTVTYDVADAEQSTLTISIEVSNDNGTTWNFNYGTATNDIGTVSGVSSVASHKTITWTYSGTYNDQFIIKIIADDLVGDQIYYSGQVYNTVTIGSQVWLKENLNVGTRINGNSDQTNNSTIEKYCYDDNEANCTAYGGLYQWNEAMSYSTTPGAIGICPTGWHIPTKAEFETLAAVVSNDGNKLKAVGQGSGTNTSGFSALLAGYRSYAVVFQGLNIHAVFWSSTTAINAYYLYLQLNDSSVYWVDDRKDYGFSVRCLKD